MENAWYAAGDWNFCFVMLVARPSIGFGSTADFLLFGEPQSRGFTHWKDLFVAVLL